MAETRIISAAAAILEATAQCLAADPRVYLMGEGVADPKGIFGTTLGLIEQFGPDRIIDMPVAENGLTGIAIGSALMGRRPVMVHQRVDFAMLALEQLGNNAAKMFFVSNGAHRVPLTVRMIIGRGWGQGPEHSQALEPVFAHFPGLKVAMPATPYDAKGLLIAAIEDDNPVILLEHRWMHYATAHVPQRSAVPRACAQAMRSPWWPRPTCCSRRSRRPMPWSKRAWRLIYSICA
jgi:pyruvate dehydrogenase E1 component beta subunit